MGSSVSPVVANLYMEDFEERAITSAPCPPHVWLRYVDDTFVVIHEYDIDSFTAHINSQDPHIKFTMERDIEGKLPFLDTEVILHEDATVRTRVYRKPTHTDQYLNWSSNHHLSHKRSVVRTLLERADTLVTTEEDKKEEVQHVKHALAANGYQQWMFKLPNKKKIETTTTTSSQDRPKINTPIALPYIKDLSDNIQRLFKQYNIPSYHKPFNTIRSLLVKPKDKTPKESQCGTVYHIKCRDCDAHYIGETARNLSTRFKEHTARKGINSAVKDHLDSTGHKCCMEDIKILDREDNWHRRKIKEAIMIQRHNPSLNRDKGLELAPVYSSLLSRDSR